MAIAIDRDARVRELFADARTMAGAGIERLEAEDMRDAAEKAWCAALNATNALILAHTGISWENTR